nr:efflux RND transporter permease subunit [Klebsiella quasipneumoniae]
MCSRLYLSRCLALRIFLRSFTRNNPNIIITLEAVRMRLRPILMTSLAFILGVMPLVISSGAGSGAQNAVGTGVMGGMVTATILAIFFVPVFFVVVRRR